MRCLLLFSVIIVVNSALVARADEIRGFVSFRSSTRNCPVSGLTVEVDPRKDSPQPTVLTVTAQDGSFNAKVAPGRYLLLLYQKGIKVYQSEIKVGGTVYKPIALGSAEKSAMAQCEVVVPQAVGSFFAYDYQGVCTIRTQPIRVEEHAFARLFELDSAVDLYLFVRKTVDSRIETDEYTYFKIPREARARLLEHGSYPSRPEGYLDSLQVHYTKIGVFSNRIEGDSMAVDDDYRLNFVSIDRSSQNELRSVVVNVCAVWR